LDPLIIREQFALEFIQEPLVERVLEGDLVERKLFRIPFVPYFKDQLIEVVGSAAVGGKDFQLSTPEKSRETNRIKSFRIAVEREFIKDAIAAFAGLRVDIGGHAVNAATVSEPQCERGIAGVIDDVLAEVARCGMKNVHKTFGVLEEQFRLDFVTAGDPRVEARAFAQLPPNNAVRGSSGKTDLARFDAQFHPGIVRHPSLLKREEHDIALREDFAFAGEIAWYKGWSVHVT
jgi:hypothetical protein